MRLIFLFFLLCIDIYAIEASYEVSFGIVGEIGKADAYLNTEAKRYIVEIEAYTTGFAKVLSGSRREKFKSEGTILTSGELKPIKFTHIVTRKKRKSGFNTDVKKWKKALYKKVKIYKFKQDKIIEERINYIDDEIISKSKKELSFYANDDLLSLFFNFKIKTNHFNLDKKSYFFAVGANKKDGKVEIAPMNKALRKEIFKDKKGYFFTATINQDIFSSKKGELYLLLDDDGICQEAVLKDVLFFGDIRGKLVKKDAN